MGNELMKSRYMRELKLKDEVEELKREVSALKRMVAIRDNKIDNLQHQLKCSTGVVYTQDDLPERYVLVLPSKVITTNKD